MRIAETAPPYGGPPDAGPPEDMPERALWRLWQKRAARQQEFRTPQGRRVRVLFPGRRGVTAGPDFRAALLEIEGLGLVRGDVEIHRRADDWDAHGHTDDPNYSGVALHAALDTPSADGAPAHTPRPGGGGEIPLISLTPLLSPDTDDDDESAPNAPGKPGSSDPPATAPEPGADANPGPPPGNAIPGPASGTANSGPASGTANPGPASIGGAAVETGAANSGPPPVDGDAAAESDNANPGQPTSVATAKPAGPGRLPGNTRIPVAANPGQPSGLATTETDAPNLIPPDDGVAAAKPGRPKLIPPDDGVAAAKPGRPNPVQPSVVATAAPGNPGLLSSSAGRPGPDATPPAFHTLWGLLAAQGFPPPASADEAAALLDRAGDARFAAKARLLARFSAEQPPQQTLYEALLEGLGYRVNQAPFLRLAQQAPYAAIAQAAGRVLEQQRPAAIAGWLLAASGLDGATNPTLPPGFGGPVARREWALFRVRPANHPARRIQGAGTLLARFLTGNHPPGLAGGLMQAAAAGRPAALTAALTVEAAAGESTASIGAGRARDLAVNVALPFLHAMHGNPAANPPPISRHPESPQTETPSPESPYLELYRRFPSLPANEIIRQMGEQLLPAQWRKTITGARRQQGLLHLAACLRGANSGSPSV